MGYWNTRISLYESTTGQDHLQMPMKALFLKIKQGNALGK